MDECGYENGKIYKVVDENDNIIYIGSTKTTLKERWKKHQLKCDENKIILIENYPCESRKELCKYEQKFIDFYNEIGLINKNKAYRTEEEKKQNKKEYNQSDKSKEQQKKYKQSDKWKEYKKEYNKRKENCPHCDKLMLKASISAHIKNSCKKI